MKKLEVLLFLILSLSFFGYTFTNTVRDWDDDYTEEITTYQGVRDSLANELCGDTLTSDQLHVESELSHYMTKQENLRNRFKIFIK